MERKVLALDDLIERATEQDLDETEISAVSDLAVQTGRKDELLLTLLLSGTACSRSNLVRLRTQAGVMPTRVTRLVKPIENLADQEIPGFPFIMTSHAFHRFQERHPEMTMEQLQYEASQSRPQRERTFTGQEQWVSPAGITFVLKRDRNLRIGIVCVTILPSEDAKSRARRTPRVDKALSRRFGG
jgi:hypothetical protein